jgi:hypothetical protein
MVNKMQILPLDHFLLVMQQLAHFHGRWLTYRWMGEAGSLPQATYQVCFSPSKTFLAVIIICTSTYGVCEVALF